MAFEKIGLGGILKFDDSQARTAMKRTSVAFQRLQMQAAKLGAGMRQVGQGMRTLGMASIASAATMGFGVKKAMDFEHQMGAVGAITRATKEELRDYTLFARKLGIETAFSATESAKAMEILGKAGLVGVALKDATKGTTDLAAATGTDMPSAADVLITTLKTMNKSMKESKYVSDALALATTTTKADVIGLGESFAKGGATAEAAGVKFEDLTAIFGLLADRSMKGSAAGTGFMAMMRGFLGTSKKASGIMKKLGINIQQFGGDMSRLPEMIDHVGARMDASFGTGKESINRKIKALGDVFGRWGVVAINNLAKEGGKRIRELSKQFSEAGNVTDEFGNKIGQAAWMAQKRLDTATGAVTLFKSSLESFSIILFERVLGPMKTRIKAVTQHFNNLLFTITALGEDQSVERHRQLVEKYGQTTVDVAMGIRGALWFVKQTWADLRKVVVKVIGLFDVSMGPGRVAQVIKYGLGIVMLAASFAPVIAALFVVKMLFMGLFNIVAGGIKIVWALGGVFLSFAKIAISSLANVGFAARVMWRAIMGPIGIVAAAAGIFFMGFRKQGESAGDTFKRMFGDVIPIFTKLINTVWTSIKGIIPPLMEMLKQIGKTVMGMIEVLQPVFSELVRIVGGPLKALGRVLGTIFGDIVKVLGVIFTAVGKLLKGLRPVILLVTQLGNLLWKLIKPVIGDIAEMLKGIVTIIGGIVHALTETLVVGIKWVVRQVARALYGIATVAGVFPGIDTADLKRRAKELGKWAGATMGIGEGDVGIRGVAGMGPQFAGTAMPVRTRREALVRARKGAEFTHAMSMEQKRYLEAQAEARRQREEARKRGRKMPPINLSSKSTIDGRCVAAAQERHRVEIQERAGFGTTPWQRRAAVTRAGEGSMTPQGRT